MGVKHTADGLQKKRNDQLEGIIKQIKTFINNKGAGEGLDYVLYTATGATEQLVTGVPRANITSLAGLRTCKAMELSLKHGNKLRLSDFLLRKPVRRHVC
jgi:hypothetical protein